MVLGQPLDHPQWSRRRRGGQLPGDPRHRSARHGQRPGRLLVEDVAGRAAQPDVEDVVHEGVPELQVRAGVDEDAGLDRLLEGAGQLGGRPVGHRGDVGRGELGAEQGRPVEHGPGLRGQVAEPAVHGVEQRGRRRLGRRAGQLHRAALVRHGAVVQQDLQDLPDVEGISRGTGDELGQPGAGVATRDPAGQLRCVHIGQRVQAQQRAARRVHPVPQAHQRGRARHRVRQRPAGDDEQQRRAPRQRGQPVQHEQARLVHPLQVVDDEHERPPGAELVHMRQQLVDGGGDRVARGEPVGDRAGPQRAGEHVQRELRTHLLAGAPGDPAPVGARGQRHREQARRADPRLALDPERPAPAARHPGEESPQPFDLRGPPHERARRGLLEGQARLGGRRGDEPARPARRLGGQVQRRVERQHLLVQAAQPLPRLDAELTDQVLACLAEDLERLGVPPAAVQRQHQQLAQRLADRVLPDQAGELGAQLPVPAQRQRGGRVPLHRRQPQLRQPLAFGLGERPGHAGQRVAPPQPERGAERLHDGRDVLAATGLGAGPLEHRRVHIGLTDAQGVAGRVRHDQAGRATLRPRGIQRPAQVRDVGVQVSLGTRGRGLAPHRRDQLGAGDHAAGAHRQRREDRALPGRAQWDLRGTAPRPQRTEHLDPEPFVHRHPTVSTGQQGGFGGGHVLGRGVVGAVVGAVVGDARPADAVGPHPRLGAPHVPAGADPRVGGQCAPERRSAPRPAGRAGPAARPRPPTPAPRAAPRRRARSAPRRQGCGRGSA